MTATPYRTRERAAVMPSGLLPPLIFGKIAALTGWLDFFERKRRPLPTSLLLSWLIIALVISWAVFPGLFTSFDPLNGIGKMKLLPPSWIHWFGTDALGRDLYARIVYGSSQSLTGAFIAVGLGFLLGTFLGLVAGSTGKWTDTVVMRLVDVLLSIPSLLLSLSIIVVFGSGTMIAAIAVGVASVASFARLARSEVLRVRHMGYVEAAIGSGGRFPSILWRHILPNSLTSVVALAALQFGSSILALSTLGFLGYGAPPPTPEWGLLIAEGRNYLARAWWLITAPGIVVILVVLATNRISHFLSGEQ